MKKLFSTNTPSEKRVGYSRAVLIDTTLHITGTTSVDEQGQIIGNTLYEQCQFIFDKIERVLTQAQFQRKDIVSLTVYITSMEFLQEFDQAFKERFFDSKPCCTLVGVTQLVDAKLLVEIAGVAQKENEA